MVLYCLYQTVRATNTQNNQRTVVSLNRLSFKDENNHAEPESEAPYVVISRTPSSLSLLRNPKADTYALK